MILVGSYLSSGSVRTFLGVRGQALITVLILKLKENFIKCPACIWINLTFKLRHFSKYLESWKWLTQGLSLAGWYIIHWHVLSELYTAAILLLSSCLFAWGAILENLRSIKALLYVSSMLGGERVFKGDWRSGGGNINCWLAIFYKIVFFVI